MRVKAVAPLVKTLFPIFVGATPEGEKIILYRRTGIIEELHIQLPEGELWALSPGSKLVSWVDEENSLIHVAIESPEWSGTATGTREELIDAEPR